MFFLLFKCDIHNQREENKLKKSGFFKSLLIHVIHELTTIKKFLNLNTQ